MKLKYPQRYDSKFEYDLHKGPLKGSTHHPTLKIDYSRPHTYEPDFLIGNTIIESKGRFRTSYEASKYIYIRECLPKKYKLVFVFQNPKCPMPGSRKRKDGTRMSHAEWADKNKFEWYDKNTAKKLIKRR